MTDDVLGEIKRTPRGFEILEFSDAYSKLCSIQESSAINDQYEDAIRRPGSSYLWLGCGEERMHLSRQQIAALCRIMRRWIETGHLGETL